MRTVNDLNPAERSAYKVWQSKLKDRTLSAAQHDECRREIDKLLWQGPMEEVHKLKFALGVLVDRVERLEFHAGLNDIVLQKADDKAAAAAMIADEVDRKTAEAMSVKDAQELPAEPVDVTEEKPVKETRGRKARRFHPEKDANKRWQILDREADEFTAHGPYKTRREAKEMADTLNNMPNQPPVPIDAPDQPETPGPLPAQNKVYHDGDGVIRDVEPVHVEDERLEVRHDPLDLGF